MNKQIRYFSVIVLLLYLMFPFGKEKVWGQESKTAYGLMVRSYGETFPVGIVSFKLNDPSKLTMEHELSVNNADAGVCINDVYYYYEYKAQIYGYDAIGFYSVDMKTGVLKQIADYGSTAHGVTIYSPTYDYSSETLYALNGFDGGNGLEKVDLKTGAITQVCTFDIQDKTGFEADFRSIACNYDGEMYGITYWGKLYHINQYTGECVLIGTLDHIPAKSTALMYLNCIAFDNDSGKLYWANCDYYDPSAVRIIDTKTAKTTEVGPIEGNHILSGIYIPFTIAEASAPNEVSNYTLTPGANGAHTATLEWDNPTKTYGRGGTLESLTSMDIYRNNVKIKSLENPVIGGHMKFIDENVENGYYSYKVVGVNEAGKGKPKTLSKYIGNGKPMPVTDLKLVPDNHHARLTWTVPPKGQYESYIDPADLKYNIIRYPDSVVVATGVKGNSFVDASMKEVALLHYTVQAENAQGKSVTTQSNDTVIGPAIVPNYTFKFDNQNQFNIWTVIDANGNDKTWEWTGLRSTLLGANCSYFYDEIAASDWMISPAVALKAGKAYKVTFDALPASKKVMETLAFTFGQGVTIASQDSVNQWDLLADSVQHMRQNLPVVKADGEYNFGFYLRSYVKNFNLTIGNIKVEEDHEGYVAGIVSSNSKPIAGATVLADGGKYTATTDANGKYILNYLPTGDYEITVKALGYDIMTSKAAVTELKTTKLDFSLTALPVYKVSGKVVDVANEPVKNAKIALAGYNDYSTTTDANGQFSFLSVFKSDDYTIAISKNKMMGYNDVLKVAGNTDLGSITLKDNIKPANRVKVTPKNGSAKISWSEPYNDPKVFRHDDGSYVSTLGIESGTTNSVLGSIYRTPATVTGISWFLTGSVQHSSVHAFVFLLDSLGNISREPVYHNTYVENTDDQWCSFTLPNPVEAPYGFMVGLSYDGYLGLAYDSGKDATYPFSAKSNCFIQDYSDSTKTWYFLDNTNYKGNFLLRATAIPYNNESDAPRYIKSKESAMPVVGAKNLLLRGKLSETPVITQFKEPQRTIEDRVRYNVYRMNSADIANPDAWTTLATNQAATSFDDSQWGSLQQGVYDYAVKAVYTGNLISEAAFADSIGKDMAALIKFNLTTNTVTNESAGAVITLANTDGIHGYQKAVDKNGKVQFDNIWKGKYNISIYLDGFDLKTDSNVDFSKESAYEKNYQLIETKVKPFHLTLYKEGPANQRLLVWNFPDLLYDGFEDHEDFMVNSPGTLGWQYIDGDGQETGAIGGYTWPNQFAKMAYIVFNPTKTVPVLDDYTFYAHGGNKYLACFASSVDSVANDDWLISPRLYFTEDYQLRFYAKSAIDGYLENFMTGYSTTGIEPKDFTWIKNNEEATANYTEYKYDIPADAKYVAVRHTAKGKRVFFLDDIRIGLASAMSDDPGYIAPWGHYKAPKAPTAAGAYEVYLDGTKVADTDETTYTFESLKEGKHVAGVIASYTSGKTDMSTIEFTVTPDGLNVTQESTVTVYVDQSARKLFVKGTYDRIDLTGMNGKTIRLNVFEGNQGIDISALNSGIYVVTVHKDNSTVTHKIIVR